MAQNIEYTYDTEKLNAKGLREGEQIGMSNTSESIAFRHIYNNGLLQETTDYQFIVEEKTPLVASYKDGQPWQGYVVIPSEFELPIISYYEGGMLITQYNITLQDMLQANEGYNEEAAEQEHAKAFPFKKTEYKNGKPLLGMVHHGYKLQGDNAHLLATEHYEHGEIKTVNLWLMAIHYAEMISLKISNNGYQVFKEKGHERPDEEDTRPRTIRVEYQDNTTITIALYLDEKEVKKTSVETADISLPLKAMRSSVLYFPSSTGCTYLQRHSISNNRKLIEEVYSGNTHLISQMSMNLSNAAIPIFLPTAQNDYTLLFQELKRPPIFDMLILNENGTPERGLLIEKDTSLNRYKYTRYAESKVIENGSNLTAEQLLTLDAK